MSMYRGLKNVLSNTSKISVNVLICTGVEIVSFAANMLYHLMKYICGK